MFQFIIVGASQILEFFHSGGFFDVFYWLFLLSSLYGSQVLLLAFQLLLDALFVFPGLSQLAFHFFQLLLQLLYFGLVVSDQLLLPSTVLFEPFQHICFIAQFAYVLVVGSLFFLSFSAEYLQFLDDAFLTIDGVEVLLDLTFIKSEFEGHGCIVLLMLFGQLQFFCLEMFETVILVAQCQQLPRSLPLSSFYPIALVPELLILPFELVLSLFQLFPRLVGLKIHAFLLLAILHDFCFQSVYLAFQFHHAQWFFILHDNCVPQPHVVSDGDALHESLQTFLRELLIIVFYERDEFFPHFLPHLFHSLIDGACHFFCFFMFLFSQFAALFLESTALVVQSVYFITVFLQLFAFQGCLLFCFLLGSLYSGDEVVLLVKIGLQEGEFGVEFDVPLVQSISFLSQVLCLLVLSLLLHFVAFSQPFFQLFQFLFSLFLLAFVFGQFLGELLAVLLQLLVVGGQFLHLSAAFPLILSVFGVQYLEFLLELSLVVTVLQVQFLLLPVHFYYYVLQLSYLSLQGLVLHFQCLLMLQVLQLLFLLFAFGLVHFLQFQDPGVELLVLSSQFIVVELCGLLQFLAFEGEVVAGLYFLVELLLQLPVLLKQYFFFCLVFLLEEVNGDHFLFVLFFLHSNYRLSQILVEAGRCTLKSSNQIF